MSYNRSFRLTLPDETFRKWKHHYPGWGTRQAIMRRVVELMIKCAEACHESNLTDTMTMFDNEMKLLFHRWNTK